MKKKRRAKGEESAMHMGWSVEHDHKQAVADAKAEEKASAEVDLAFMHPPDQTTTSSHHHTSIQL